MIERWRPDFIDPAIRAARRLVRPDVRIVTGGVAFYALFAIFPLIYMTLTLLTFFLPPELAHDLAKPIANFFSQSVEPLTFEEVDAIQQMTPAGLSLRAFLAAVLVMYTATSGAKALITGIRMIAGTADRTRFAPFQGTSLLLTALLILIVWLLGAAQLVVTVAVQESGEIALRFAHEIATIVDSLWISKGIASFGVFYLILVLSLRGHVRRGTRALAAGAAAAALAFLGVTFLFQLYLHYSVLGTIYGALASVIFGFIWLSASVSSLLLGAALATEWAHAWGEDDEEVAEA
ncbi:YihY/virulence factor BrkB family protein [Hyphomonas sp. WL0036]|uniref:YhjD/YihY/BrkB family envelope integrity protein n=1 Tax=Hyphomonas sediminis TaxID=2866160 RepID=UPI001C827E45|nr:YhjD/YihY/BrkB family envelope integrity protein [Hyphomonas sediminis]MBY9065547.1 YihY/virulence factor BrkB family protein [Hyphomonas sediminis]